MRDVGDFGLLLGIVAWRHDFLSELDFREAVREWKSHPSEPFADILLAREALRIDQLQVVSALAAAHLDLNDSLAQCVASGSGIDELAEKLRQIPADELQSALQRVRTEADEFVGAGATRMVNAATQAVTHPAYPVQLDSANQTVVSSNAADPQATVIKPPEGEETIVSEDPSTIVQGEGQSSAESSAPDHLSLAMRRFQIVRPFAEGGLGRVSIAIDQELNREVAFKEIKSQFSRDAASRSRFLIEAEITGGLEHPGIVPVYGLGLFEDGRPFYAMRFIRGESLQDAIQKFHAERRAPGGALAHSVEFRSLLNRFIDVCQAMEYAHGRGVLHRDLKPANIMLGKYGETLVVDWGLAKSTGRSHRVPETPDAGAAETPLVSASGENAELTQAGAAIGTPLFMSPEQARGLTSELTPASDIYSLGATLYQLLTALPPIGAKPGQQTLERFPLREVLERVRTGNFHPPRAVNPDVPQPMNAICLKAMSLAPEDRYGSAMQLASDLERWLADEPVTAWREPRRVRIRRWIRQHQTLVGTVAAGILVTVISLTVLTLVVSGKNEQLAQANGKLEEVVQQLDTSNQQLDEKNRSLSQLNTDLKVSIDQANAARERETAARREEEKARLAETRAREQEAAARLLAEQRERESFELLYTNDMKLAYEALNSHDVTQIPARLKRYEPEGSRTDVRGFEWFALRSITQPQPRPIKAFGGPMHFLRYAPNGKFFVAGRLYTVQIFDAQTLAVLKTFPVLDEIRSVAVSPDSKLVAAIGHSRLLHVFDVEQQKPVHRLVNALSGAADQIEFSPNGEFLVTGAGGKEVKIWKTQTGEVVRTLSDPAQGGNASWPTYSPNGELIAVSTRGDRSDVLLYEAATGKLVASIPAEGRCELSAFVPTEPWLTINTSSGFRIFDVSKPTEAKLIGQMPMLDRIRTMNYSADGKRLGVGQASGIAQVFDFERWSPQQSKSLPERREWQAHSQACFSVAMSPTNDDMVTGSADGSLHVWRSREVLGFTKLNLPAAERRAIEFAPESWNPGKPQWVLVADHLGVRAVDPATGKTELMLKDEGTAAAPERHRRPICSVSPSGAVAVFREQDAIELWEPASDMPAPGRHREIKVDSDCWGLSLSPRAQRLTFNFSPQEMRTYDLTNQDAFVIGAAGSRVRYLNEDTVAAFVTLTLSVRDVRERDRILKFIPNVQAGVPQTMAIHPTQPWLITAGERTIRIWHRETWEMLREIAGHQSPVMSLAMTPDGRTLASGDQSGVVKFWHIASGSEVGQLSVSRNTVRHLHFDAAGKRLIGEFGQADWRLLAPAWPLE